MRFGIFEESCVLSYLIINSVGALNLSTEPLAPHLLSAPLKSLASR